MLNTDIFVRMAVGDAETPTLFPYPLPFHIIFALIAAIFFIFRFVTDRKPFQLIFAIAVPFSLTLWISDNRTWFYIVGAIELLFVLAALVSAFVYKGKSSPAEAGDAADTEASAEAEEVSGEADGE